MNLKVLFSYVIKYMLSLVFFLLLTSSIFCFYFSNPKYWYRIIKEQKYVDYLDISIKEGMKNYTLSSGLKEEILENIYQKEEIEQEIHFQIQNILKENSEIDTTNLRIHLEENINNYLNKNNLVIESKEKGRFVTQIENVYKSEISLYGYIDTLKVYIQKMNKILKITIWTSFFLFLFLYFIQTKILKDFSLVTCFLTSALLMVSIVIFINCNINRSHINIFNPNFSKLFTKVIEDILIFFQNTSIFLILFAIFISIIPKKIVRPRPKV